MLTRQEAEAIYNAGKDTVVRVLPDLSAKVDQPTADFAVLKAENAALRERVQTLEEQVAKDSHNSHKPPSSDGLSKPKPKSLRPKSDRPTGGQPGHPGHTLRMVEKPDRIVPHRVERCARCGRSLTGRQPDHVERRQVHDLPEPKLEVTEHQAEVKACPCGCVNRAAFPPEAAAPVQYGPRVKSVAVYLGEYQLLPFDYDCDHALCNGHLLRELIFLWEQLSQKWAKAMIDHLLAIKQAVATARAAGLTALPSSDQERFLKEYERIVHTGYAQNPVAAPHGPKRRGRRKQSKARNLLDRFRDHPDEILAFLRDFAIPFDNNQSERDLRMTKLRQKISGPFRSFPALVNFCRIRGYVSTARKNGLNALDALQRVFLGTPFVPTINTARPAPTRSPPPCPETLSGSRPPWGAAT